MEIATLRSFLESVSVAIAAICDDCSLMAPDASFKTSTGDVTGSERG